MFENYKEEPRQEAHEGVNLTAANELIARLESSLGDNGRLAQEEVEEAQEMVTTLEGLQSDLDPSPTEVNTALAKLRNFLFQNESKEAA